ncbi:MAG TPA: arylesterase [Gemmatimonadales bacterium]|nr:arylesterase [Gemmatimonadales bacterium]
MISRWAAVPLLLAALACAAADDPAPEARDPAAPADDRSTIVFLGTSLTAGLGLDPSEAYPALIQQRIDEAGLPFSVVNAGVSGETSAGARQRIDWLLQRQVDVLVVETGANDGLRGIDPSAVRDNLDAILDRAEADDPPPALVVIGMEAPPNLGTRYTSAFRQVFRDVAEDHGAAFIPFLLEGVAGVERLNQGDGIHPTAEGQRRIADIVWRALEPVLRERAARVREAA